MKRNKENGKEDTLTSDHLMTNSDKAIKIARKEGR